MKKLRKVLHNEMKTLRKILRNEDGFAVSLIILVVALFAVVIAAMTIAGRSTSTTGSEQAGKVHASVIVQQGNNLKGGFDVMINGKSIAINQITFDNAANTGLFHPTDGTVPEQIPPSEALVTATNKWVFKRDNNGDAVVKLKGIGLDANADYVIALVDLKSAVCEQINKMLYGTSNVPSVTIASTAWNTPETAVDLSADDNVDRRPYQCVKTSDDKYVYYQVIVEQ